MLRSFLAESNNQAKEEFYRTIAREQLRQLIKENDIRIWRYLRHNEGYV